MWNALPTFMTPLALVGGILVTGILLRLFRQSHRKAPPIDFPWKGLFFVNPPQASSIPPFWLMVLLCALFLLTIAATQPIKYDTGNEPEYCVVLPETGLEAQSIEQGNRPRLDHLVDLLTQWAGKRPSRDRFLLISAGIQPSESNDWLSAAELARHLRMIEAVDGPTDWQTAFDRAEVHLGRTDGTLVVAAGTPETHHTAWLRKTMLDDRSHVYLRSGEPAPNAGVESISVFHSPFAESSNTLDVHVRLRAFGDEQTRRLVFRLNGNKLILPGGDSSGEIPIRITPGHPTTIPLIGIPESGRLEIKLMPPDDQPADDLARAVIPELKTIRVGLLHTALKVQAVLERLPGFEVEVTQPDQVSSSIDICIADARKISRADLPDKNCLIFAGEGRPVDAMLLGTDDHHPLCKGVGPPDFRSLQIWLPEVTDVNVAMLASQTFGGTIPSGVARPALWTETHRGQRIVGFAFDPFRFDFDRFRKVPILLANSLEWLSSLADKPLAVHLGAEPDFLQDTHTLIWNAPADAAEGRAAEPNPIEALEKAGFYRALARERSQWHFAANAPTRPIVNEPGGPIQQATVVQTAPDRRDKRRSVDFWLWVGSLGLLALELFLYFLSSVTWKNPFHALAERRLHRLALRNAGANARRR